MQYNQLRKINDFALILIFIMSFLSYDTEIFANLTDIDAKSKIILDKSGYIEMKEISESKLIKLSKSGNKKAFVELIRRTSPKIYSLCWRLTGNQQDSEDLFQETYIKAFESIKSFKGKSEFSTYLYRIATNIFLNKKRKKAVFLVSMDNPVETEDGELQRQFFDDSPSVEEQMRRKRDIALVEKAVNLLPPKLRFVIVLRFMEHKSYEEIGEICKCSSGTVASRIFRALRKLKKLIEGRI